MTLSDTHSSLNRPGEHKAGVLEALREEDEYAETDGLTCTVVDSDRSLEPLVRSPVFSNRDDSPRTSARSSHPSVPSLGLAAALTARSAEEEYTQRTYNSGSSSQFRGSNGALDTDRTVGSAIQETPLHSIAIVDTDRSEDMGGREEGGGTSAGG